MTTDPQPVLTPYVGRATSDSPSGVHVLYLSPQGWALQHPKPGPGGVCSEFCPTQQALEEVLDRTAWFALSDDDFRRLVQLAPEVDITMMTRPPYWVDQIGQLLAYHGAVAPDGSHNWWDRSALVTAFRRLVESWTQPGAAAGTFNPADFGPVDADPMVPVPRAGIVAYAKAAREHGLYGMADDFDKILGHPAREEPEHPEVVGLRYDVAVSLMGAMRRCNMWEEADRLRNLLRLDEIPVLHDGQQVGVVEEVTREPDVIIRNTSGFPMPDSDQARLDFAEGFAPAIDAVQEALNSAFPDDGAGPWTGLAASKVVRGLKLLGWAVVERQEVHDQWTGVLKIEGVPAGDQRLARSDRPEVNEVLDRLRIIQTADWWQHVHEDGEAHYYLDAMLRAAGALAPDPRPTELDSVNDLLHTAWGIIANAQHALGNGMSLDELATAEPELTTATEEVEWARAAVRFRDAYHLHLGIPTDYEVVEAVPVPWVPSPDEADHTLARAILGQSSTLAGYERDWVKDHYRHGVSDFAPTSLLTRCTLEMVPAGAVWAWADEVDGAGLIRWLQAYEVGRVADLLGTIGGQADAIRTFGRLGSDPVEVQRRLQQEVAFLDPNVFTGHVVPEPAPWAAEVWENMESGPEIPLDMTAVDKGDPDRPTEVTSRPTPDERDLRNQALTLAIGYVTNASMGGNALEVAEQYLAFLRTGQAPPLATLG